MAVKSTMTPPIVKGRPGYDVASTAPNAALYIRGETPEHTAARLPSAP